MGLAGRVLGRRGGLLPHRHQARVSRGPHSGSVGPPRLLLPARRLRTTSLGLTSSRAGIASRPICAAALKKSSIVAEPPAGIGRRRRRRKVFLWYRLQLFGLGFDTSTNNRRIGHRACGHPKRPEEPRPLPADADRLMERQSLLHLGTRTYNLTHIGANRKSRGHPTRWRTSSRCATPSTTARSLCSAHPGRDLGCPDLLLALFRRLCLDRLDCGSGFGAGGRGLALGTLGRPCEGSRAFCCGFLGSFGLR